MKPILRTGTAYLQAIPISQWFPRSFIYQSSTVSHDTLSGPLIQSGGLFLIVEAEIYGFGELARFTSVTLFMSARLLCPRTVKRIRTVIKRHSGATQLTVHQQHFCERPAARLLILLYILYCVLFGFFQRS